MAWTYDPALPSAKDKVRFFVQDTDTNDQLITDAEITAALTANGQDTYRAGALVARSIALQLGRRPSVKLALVGLSSKEQYDQYMKLADDLDSKAVTQGGAGIFGGGISKSDRDTREQDTDRVRPAFTIDLHRSHS